MEPMTPLEILFGDPDLAANRPLRVELRRRGARVTVATTSARLLEEVAAHPPDLLVLDEGVSGKEDGVDVLSHVGEHGPDTKIILLHSGLDVPSHGSEMGLLFSAHKPASKSALLEVITSAFPGRLKEDPEHRPETHTILCVDDDREYLNSLSRFLKRRGYRVICHDNARRALEALPEMQPDLAIVDIRMPGMDGLALTRRIHERSGGKVPVVVLTGLNSSDTHRRARESGASYCLTKPCRPEDFLNVVDFIAGDLDEEERRLLRSHCEPLAVGAAKTAAPGP